MTNPYETIDPGLNTTGPMENTLPNWAGVSSIPSDSLLTISVMGVTRFQMRNLTQTLEIASEATQMERTINGVMINLSPPQFQKYTTKISIPNEVEAPPIDGIFPGLIVVMQCAVQLVFPLSGGVISGPNRPVVSGSYYTANGYGFYRPELTMMIRTISEKFDEWGAKVSTDISADEV